MTATATNEHTQYLTCSQAARLCPTPVSPSAVWRWMRNGIVARDGEKVYLRHVRIGRRVYTTRHWLDEHWTALAEADRQAFEREGESSPRSGRKPTIGRDAEARSAAIQRADSKLKEAGI